jgi:hypothetical protein
MIVVPTQHLDEDGGFASTRERMAAARTPAQAVVAGGCARQGALPI